MPSFTHNQSIILTHLHTSVKLSRNRLPMCYTLKCLKHKFKSMIVLSFRTGYPSIMTALINNSIQHGQLRSISRHFANYSDNIHTFSPINRDLVVGIYLKIFQIFSSKCPKFCLLENFMTKKGLSSIFQSFDNCLNWVDDTYIQIQWKTR